MGKRGEKWISVALALYDRSRQLFPVGQKKRRQLGWRGVETNVRASLAEGKIGNGGEEVSLRKPGQMTEKQLDGEKKDWPGGVQMVYHTTYEELNERNKDPGRIKRIKKGPPVLGGGTPRTGGHRE